MTTLDNGSPLWNGVYFKVDLCNVQTLVHWTAAFSLPKMNELLLTNGSKYLNFVRTYILGCKSAWTNDDVVQTTMNRQEEINFDQF